MRMNLCDFRDVGLSIPPGSARFKVTLMSVPGGQRRSAHDADTIQSTSLSLFELAEAPK